MFRLCDDLLRALVKGLRATIARDYTGKVVLTLNFHMGTLTAASVGFDSHQKPEGRITLE